MRQLMGYRGRRIAFWVVGVIYAMFLAASSAPSPLYVVYQAQWRFSAGTLTVVFAVYVFALLGALLLTGSISDHVGRRPTLLIAGAVQVAAMVMFALADGVGWLFLARVLQGAATGVATGALSAWLLDLQPTGRLGLGTTVSSTAPPAGLALGAVGAGVLVQYAPAPTHLVYWLLTGVFGIGVLGFLAVPETVHATGSWWRELRPRVGVPPQARGAFAAVAPLLIANWALSGLFLSLGGSLTAGVLHSRSHVVAGLVVVALAGTGVVAGLLTSEIGPRALMLAGSPALVAGLVLTLFGVDHGSAWMFFAGTVIAGLGFGPAWTGAFRTVLGKSPADQRAALVAAIFLVSYVAFSVPAIAAGVATTHIGLQRTTIWYGVIVIGLTGTATVVTLIRKES